MVKYCLDTDIIIDFFRGNALMIEKIQKLSEFNELFLTVISLCEIFRGIYSYSKGKEQEKELGDIDVFLQRVNILSLDINSSREFGKISAELKRRGKMTQELDLMIASIAKSNNTIIVTRNRKHFENTGVNVEIW